MVLTHLYLPGIPLLTFSNLNIEATDLCWSSSLPALRGLRCHSHALHLPLLPTTILPVADMGHNTAPNKNSTGLPGGSQRTQSDSWA